MFSCKNIFVPTNPEVRAPRIMAGNQRFCDHLQAQLCVFVSISGETSQWKEAGAVNVAVCAWDPSPREAKADRSWVQGLPVLCREILSQINTNCNNKRNNAGRLRFFSVSSLPSFLAEAWRTGVQLWSCVNSIEIKAWQPRLGEKHCFCSVTKEQERRCVSIRFPVLYFKICVNGCFVWKVLLKLTYNNKRRLLAFMEVILQRGHRPKTRASISFVSY